MTKQRIAFAGLCAALALTPAAAAGAAEPLAGPLVQPEWVAEHSCDEGVAVLDLRASERSFRRQRIPCSIRTSFRSGGWIVATVGVAGLLPDPAALAETIGALGIGNDDHVVIVEQGVSGALGVSIAARVYWSFKALGHDAVSMLDGGFDAYRRGSELPFVQGEASTRPPAAFAPAFRPGLLATAEDVAAAAREGTTLIDSRESDIFMGINGVYYSDAPGTIPGAENVPIRWLTRRSDSRLQPLETLERIAAHSALDAEAPLIAFCNTGTMAALNWFVAHELLGNDNARLYDGSFMEWIADPERPVERRIDMAAE